MKTYSVRYFRINQTVRQITILSLFALAFPALALTGRSTWNLKFQFSSPFVESEGQRVYPPLTKTVLNTKEMMRRIAFDEHAAGHYDFSVFPEGSQLIPYGSTTFAVIDKSDQVLVVLSDIVTVSVYQGGVFQYGALSKPLYLPDPKLSTLEWVTIVFDDTGISGSGKLKFEAHGLLTESASNPKQTSTGSYSVGSILNYSNLVGTGQLNGEDFLVTGSIRASERN